MEYELSIPTENLQAHLDIEKDIQSLGNGLFTFVIRVHDGRITDYTLMEVVDARRKYTVFTSQLVKEQVISRTY